jgi:autotransporter passenger strand-loop-strand repeat protein
MIITVSSGREKYGLTISGGTTLVVLSGGFVDDTTVLSGGSALLSSGGLAYDLTVSGGVVLGSGELTGGDNTVYDGSISGITLGEDYGENFLFLEGGTASGVTVVDANTFFYVNSDASVTATIVSSGAQLWVDGSGAATRVEDAGQEYVGSGVTSGDTVERGGEEVILTGGATSGTTVQSGGLLELGGTATDVTVRSGGVFAFGGDVKSDFTARQATSTTVLSGVTVSSGAYLDLYGAKVLSGVTVSLTSGGFANDLTVSKGAVVEGPGALGGGYDPLDDSSSGTFVAGAISGVTIDGSVEIQSGGTAIGVSDEGLFQIDSGATTSGAVASNGSYVEIYGSAAGTQVGAGADEDVFAGSASDDTVESGAWNMSTRAAWLRETRSRAEAGLSNPPAEESAAKRSRAAGPSISAATSSAVSP